ncbi:MAG: hypothetical protein E7223_04500 [Clostridiales bacterium]|nr:hypothetical protein [Clostridiales bacterium]
MLIGAIFLIIGLVNVINPEIGWQLTTGWRFRDAEPSDAALVWGRIGGVLFILVGLRLLFPF